MTVITVTLSPAYDKTYYTEGFKSGEVNRAVKVKTNMGGKGINFTTALTKGNVPCIATGFLGEGRERFISFLKKEGAECDFVDVAGEIRTNIKVCDTENGIYTDINESAPEIVKEDMDKLFKKVSSICKNGDILYLGGTLPKGADEKTYARFVKIGKEAGCRVAVDASGKALFYALSEKPDIIKPNCTEAAEILGTEIESVDDAINAALKLHEMGAENVLLSLGADGAVYAGDDGVYRVYPKETVVKSTVGAGDSFLAGYIYGISKDYDTATSLKYATSFSAAKISEEGTDIPPFEKLCAYVSEIKCEHIKER